MATQPQFASTPRVDYCTANTANSALDGSGTIVSVFAGGTNGSYARNMEIKALTNTTAGMVRVFTNQSGVYHLFKEVTVSAITKSATVSSFSSTLNLNISIPNGCNLGVSTEKAETFQITVDGGDY